MTTKFTNPGLPDAWKVEQIRLSTFVNETPSSPLELWQELTHSDPTNESTERNGPVTIYQATGVVDEQPLALRVEPNRVDWISGTGSINVPPTVGVVIGEYVPITRRFTELVKPFLVSDRLSVTRMALGLNLELPVATKEEGYALLSSLLPFELDPLSSDFSYRINRRRASQTVDIDINRLSEWLVVELVTLPFNLGQPFAMNPLISTSIPVNMIRSFFAKIQLDINTAPDKALLANGEQLAALLDEMLEFSDEITREGDVP